MTQKALAADAGISASYLNLIEHNRRAVAGKVLLGIARVLGVPPGTLSDGVESALIAELRQAAAHLPRQAAELAAIDELTTRFPGWARLTTALYRQTRDQETAIAALSDRLTHDPFLAESLHSMLSNITVIRSTSNILKNITDIEPEKQARFHVIIHEESRRLSDAAQALSRYFDHATDQNAGTATPDEALDRFLQRHDFRFPEIDAHPQANAEEMATTIAQVLQGDSGLDSTESRRLAQQAMVDYAADAQKMPLAEFRPSAEKLRYDPAALARMYGVDLHAVFRRLTHLNGKEGIQIGLVIANAAGRTLARRPLADFSLPRHGAACPLWPLFQAFSHPGTVQSALVELPGQKRFIALSHALAQDAPAIGTPARYHSAMLLIPVGFQDRLGDWLPPLCAPQPIGISCRICPREGCKARSEPQILGDEG